MASKTNNNCFPILKSVFVFWKILGLCPFVIAEDTISTPSYGGILYTIIIVLAYFIIYYRAVINRMNYIMTRETPMTVIADLLALSIEFFLIISAWLYVTFRRDQFQRILKMFNKIVETSKTIDIGQDFQKIFKIIKIHTIVINIIWSILYFGDHVFLYDTRKMRLEIWLPFNFPRIVTHNIILMFIDVLWIMDQFFCSLNEKIQNLPKEVKVRLTISEGNRRSLNNGSLQYFVTASPLEAYGQMHSDLVTLTRMIVDFFALSITLIMLVHLILMASDLYLLCLMTRDREWLNWKKIASFVDLCCWWCLHFTETVTLIVISDSIANEANRTGRVLHTMLTMDRTEKYIDTAQILSLRLLQRYLYIELYGLFQIRLSVVHKIIGMVVTYVTIMMQLDIQDQQQQLMQKAML